MFELLKSLASEHPVSHAILILSLVAIVGHAIGSLKVRGLGFGIAGVLFAGILFGHFGFGISPQMAMFAREFGLVLFVYTIGMQVGPGFFASWRKGGVRLNALAAGVVIGGGALALGFGWLFEVDFAAMLGVLSGAGTNTPSLGAVEGALASIPDLDPQRQALPAMGYAIAYPFAVAGLIGVMVVIRHLFRVDLEAENAEWEAQEREGHLPLERLNLVVENRNLRGVRLREIEALAALGVTIARHRPAGEEEVRVATPETVLNPGDILLAVGTHEHLQQLRLLIGSETEENLVQAPGPVTFRSVVVSRGEAVGRTLPQLGLRERYHVNVTRIHRSDLEFAPHPSLTLQIGDLLQIVGQAEDLDKAAKVLGNEAKALAHTNFVAVFVGVALGVILGSYPLSLPGMPVPLRLGLAGGPLLVAILISRLGKIGPVVWYMPPTANLALRELGITLFLATVGLSAGEKFFSVLLSGSGWLWMALGLGITLIPLLVAAVIGRRLFGYSYATLCGLLSGSMTDPPGLAFAQGVTQSNAVMVSYATVYPMTMLLRIVVAQVLTLLFCG